MEHQLVFLVVQVAVVQVVKIVLLRLLAEQAHLGKVMLVELEQIQMPKQTVRVRVAAVLVQ
jgi:hypothetical protein